MARNLSFLLLSALTFLNLALPAGAKPNMGEVLAASKPSDWRPLDPANTLYVELPSGRIIIELKPGFAPLVYGLRPLPASHAPLSEDDRGKSEPTVYDLRGCLKSLIQGRSGLA